eukprot:SAG31_NODE_50434_length_114_cov_14.600000_1_plen_37_part_11
MVTVRGVTSSFLRGLFFVLMGPIEKCGTNREGRRETE